MCELGLFVGREKIEGATDKVTKGRDHETDKEAWLEGGETRAANSRTRKLLPSDFWSL